MQTYRIHGMRATTLALAIALSGCALSSPYVKVPPEPELCSTTSDQCIETAIRHSRQVRQIYRDVLDRYAKLRSDSGAAAIALGVAAMGAALGDANRDVFTSLGLLGATSYGYASWYGNPMREALFGQTIQALVCAEGATIKLRFPGPAREQATTLRAEAGPTRADLSRAAMDLSSASSQIAAYLAGKQADVDSAPAKSKRWKAALSTSEGLKALFKPKTDAAQAALDSVPAAYGALDDALAALAAREGAADGAGDALNQAVLRIITATDIEAQKTLPDPAAAFTIVAGFGSTAAKFIPSTSAVSALTDAVNNLRPAAEGANVIDNKMRSEVDPLLDRLGRAQQAFVAASLRLASLTRAIAARASLPAADAVTAIDKCTIAGIGPLSSAPQSVTIDAGKSATVSVDLKGGADYAVDWSGTTPKGVTVTSPGEQGSRFNVIGTPESVAGDFKVKVSDKTGRQLEIPVKVK